jgi:hypothetical protein
MDGGAEMEVVLPKARWQAGLDGESKATTHLPFRTGTFRGQESLDCAEPMKAIPAPGDTPR